MKISFGETPTLHVHFSIVCNKQIMKSWWEYPIYYCGALYVQFLLIDENQIKTWEQITDENVKQMLNKYSV